MHVEHLYLNGSFSQIWQTILGGITAGLEVMEVRGRLIPCSQDV